MSKPDHESIQPYFDSIASVLVKALLFDQNKELHGLILPKGWKEIDTPKNRGYRDPYKVIVTNPDLGIFAKLFTPETNNYAQLAYQGLRSLARLNLSQPILAPEGISSRVLFFPHGEPIRRVRYGDCFTNQERGGIDAILNENSLVSLALSDKVDIVRILGKEYVVDPFDDSVNSILDFLHPQSS